MHSGYTVVTSFYKGGYLTLQGWRSPCIAHSTHARGARHMAPTEQPLSALTLNVCQVRDAVKEARLAVEAVKKKLEALPQVPATSKKGKK